MGETDSARLEEIRRRAESILLVQRNSPNARMPVKVNMLARDDVPWLLSVAEAAKRLWEIECDHGLAGYETLPDWYRAKTKVVRELGELLRSHGNKGTKA